MTLTTFLSTSILSSVLLLYALLLTTAILVALLGTQSETKLRHAAQKHRKKVNTLRSKGVDKRSSLLASCQRRNMLELASIVKMQLKTNQDAIEFGTHHQAAMFVKNSVASLHFDRLYALHFALQKADTENVSKQIDDFLQKELQYGHTGKHREIHFQNTLHHQD